MFCEMFCLSRHRPCQKDVSDGKILVQLEVIDLETMKTVDDKLKTCFKSARPHYSDNLRSNGSLD